MFDSISEVKLGDTSNPSIEGHDYLIWLYMIDVNTAQWYVRTKESDEKLPINTDMGKHKSQRLSGMISSIENSIQRLGVVESAPSNKTQGSNKGQQSNKKYVPYRRRKKN